jgi:uncharacterized protein (DUF2336 family)
MSAMRNEVLNLAELAQRRDRQGRSELYQNIVNLIHSGDAPPSEAELTLMCDILRRLTHDVDVTVRQALAEKLAGEPDAPYELILLLANDQIEIAHPLLVNHRALQEKDLLEIIYHKTRQHQLSIASRRMLPESVSHALVSMGNEPIVIALLANQTARINERDFSHLVNKSQQITGLQKPLLSRSDLPASLAEKMYGWVSESLRQMIVENFDINPATVDKAIKSVYRELVSKDQEKAANISQAQALIDKLHESGQLKSAFLIKSLSQGEVELFELGFAKLINLKADIMRKILYNRGPDGLAIACRAVAIDRSIFLTIFKLSREARQMTARITEAEMAHAFSFFQSMDQRSALTTIHRWAGEESRAPIF